MPHVSMTEFATRYGSNNTMTTFFVDLIITSCGFASSLTRDQPVEYHEDLENSMYCIGTPIAITSPAAAPAAPLPPFPLVCDHLRPWVGHNHGIRATATKFGQARWAVFGQGETSPTVEQRKRKVR